MRTKTKRRVQQSVNELSKDLSNRLRDAQTRYKEMDVATQKKLLIAMSAAIGAIAGTVAGIKTRQQKITGMRKTQTGKRKRRK